LINEKTRGRKSRETVSLKRHALEIVRKICCTVLYIILNVGIININLDSQFTYRLLECQNSKIYKVKVTVNVDVLHFSSNLLGSSLFGLTYLTNNDKSNEGYLHRNSLFLTIFSFLKGFSNLIIFCMIEHGE
jgi:arginine/ornithine N-succinyltransferase beta subunit